MTAPRFLIDENFLPYLAERAHARGFEAMHVTHLGLGGHADAALLAAVAEGDWVIVTNNAVEFRGRYRRIDVHPGVVFLLPAVPRAQQVALFEAALDHVCRQPDLTNQALDVTFGEDGTPIVLSYDLP